LWRERLAELEHRAAVKAGEAVPVKFEADRHHRAFGSAMEFETSMAIIGGGGDSRMVEDRAVKLRGLFGLIVEPQAGRDFLEALHGSAPFRVSDADFSA
jgi:hypothetical protein